MTEPDEDERAVAVAAALVEAFGREAVELLFNFKRCDVAGQAELSARANELVADREGRLTDCDEPLL